jgi:ubiquinone biosynthesis protein Coq4
LVAYKLAIFERGPKRLNGALKGANMETLDIDDVAALWALPTGSLGHAYARFLGDNDITPLVLSDAARRRFAEAPYVLRYTTTHDLHHVLTGFDAGVAGELGVLAFSVGQGTAPVGRLSLWLGTMLAVLASPTQARATWRNAGVGLRMGERAERLLTAPLEVLMSTDLLQARASLGISADAVHAGQPSGTSVIADFFNRLVA